MKKLMILLLLALSIFLLTACKSGAEAETTTVPEEETVIVPEITETVPATVDPKAPKDDELLDNYEEPSSETQQATMPTGLHGSQPGSSNGGTNSSANNTVPQETENPWGNGANATKDDEL